MAHAVKKKPKLEASSNNELRVTYWLALSLTVIFLFYAPFQTALFNGYSAQYEGPIYSSILISSFLLILIAIYSFFNWRLESYRELLGVYIWLIPLTFWISTINAASSQLAKDMSYVHMMYAAFFLCGLYIAKNRLGAAVSQLAITLSGYAVVLYGLANMFGNAYFRDAVMLTVDGYRVTSVFQYANAYAAFLMAMFLCCLYYVTSSKKWYMSSLHALMLVPIMLCFWLTLSRGALVLFPVIFLLILPVLSLTRQLAYSVYSAIALAAVLPILKPIENRSTEIVKSLLDSIQPDQSVTKLSFFDSKSLAGWGIVLICSVAAAVIILLFQRFILPVLEQKLESFSVRKISKIILPVGLIIIIGLGAVLIFMTGLKEILPDSIQNRIETINFQQNSVLERGTFYKDSIKVIKDHPIIGTGGGGWAVLYERYQNNPYTSRQAHNFFLQYLVEVGIFGFAVLLILLLTIYWMFISKVFRGEKDTVGTHLIFYFVSLSILVHSILDFELSYVYLGSLVFLCLGGMASILNGNPSWIKKLSGAVNSKSFIYPTATSIIALIFFIFSIINVNADHSYDRAIAYAKQGKSLNEVLKPLDAAIKSTSNPDYYAQKFDFLMQVYSQAQDQQQKDSFWNQAHALTDEARKAEPNNRFLLERQYSLFVANQDYNSALKVVSEGLDKYPWELSFYERLGSLYNTIWNQSKAQNNQEATKSSWDQIQANYATVINRMADLAKLPEGQVQGRPFYLSPLIRFSTGQILAVNGELEKAIAELQPAAADSAERLKDPTKQAEIEQNKLVIRWYLAVTQKLGKPDQALYDSFTATNPQEKQQIDAIAASLK